MIPFPHRVRALAVLLGIVMFGGLGWSAPEVLNYSGKISVSGQPYTGQAYFKFALVNGAGTVSYWSNDGNFTTPQEPAQSVAATVSEGVYTIRLGDAALPGMQALPGQVFRDHSDLSADLVCPIAQRAL